MMVLLHDNVKSCSSHGEEASVCLEMNIDITSSIIHRFRLHCSDRVTLRYSRVL